MHRPRRTPSRAAREAGARIVAALAVLGSTSGCVIINNYPPEGETSTAGTDGSTGMATGTDTGPGPTTDSGAMTASTSSDSGLATESSAGSETSSSGGSTTDEPATGSGSSSSSGLVTGSTDTGSTDTDTDTDGSTGTSTGGGLPGCGNGLVEPPEICFLDPVGIGGGPGMRPAGLVFADFTDDGLPDYAEGSMRTVNMSSAARINILEADPVLGLDLGASTFVGDPATRGGVHPGSMAGQDFDGDGRVDLSFLEMDYGGPGGYTPILSIWLSQGNGTFVPSFTHAFNLFDIVDATAGEFTGDGLPDVITYDAAGLTVWGGDGAGQLVMPLAPVPPLDPSSVIPQHFDGDGITDLLVNSPAGRMIMLGQPGGTFIDVPPPACAGSLYSGSDYDGDGVIDLRCRTGDVLDTYYGLGDATFDPPVTTMLPAGVGAALRSGDFDGDGESDYMWIQSGGFMVTEAHWIRGQGGGVYDPPQLLVQDTGMFDHWQQGGWAQDVNGDGVSEVFIIHFTVINSYFMRMFVSDP